MKYLTLFELWPTAGAAFSRNHDLSWPRPVSTIEETLQSTRERFLLSINLTPHTKQRHHFEIRKGRILKTFEPTLALAN